MMTINGIDYFKKDDRWYGYDGFSNFRIYNEDVIEELEARLLQEERLSKLERILDDENNNKK